MINELSNFKYRRQFIISPGVIEKPLFNKWHHIKIKDKHLYSHPDLEINNIISDDKQYQLILIGFMLDPHKPEYSNIEILKSFLDKNFSFESLHESLFFITGRFVLLVQTLDDMFVYHDPCALRTVYFTKQNNESYIASNPGILQECLDFVYDEQYFEFVNSECFKNNIEYSLPSGISYFSSIGHLIPNHFLSCSTLEQKRYYPNSSLPSVKSSAVDETAKISAEFLVKILQAARNRFNLALPLTAGWDSRLLMAGLKDIKSDVWYYTLQYRDLNNRSDDIKIPGDILASQGLEHNIIDCKKYPNAAFVNIYNKNTALAHLNDWGITAFGLLNGFPKDKVCLKGNCSEIVRCFYYTSGSHGLIDNISLLPNKDLHSIPNIKKLIDKWFSEACIISQKNNIDILDLYYWEHRMGSWQAQSQLEWDIAQEVFTPFNCREFLEMMLSVPSSFRSQPKNKFYTKMINYLFPELMNFPVNPRSKIIKSVNPKIKKIIKACTPYGILKVLKKI